MLLIIYTKTDEETFSLFVWSQKTFTASVYLDIYTYIRNYISK